MRIGILGSGAVAKALGGGFLAHGHEAMLGTRQSAKLDDWAAQNPKGHVGSFADAPCLENFPSRQNPASSAVRQI